MNKKKLSSIIRTSLVLSIIIVPLLIASIDTLLANQPSLVERLAMVGILWGIIIFMIILVVRYYRQPDGWDVAVPDGTNHVRSNETRKIGYYPPHLIIGLISFVFSAIVALNVRGWLFAVWGIHISEIAYRWMAYSIMAITFYLVIPPILNAHRFGVKHGQGLEVIQGVDESSCLPSATVEIFRYPLRDVCLYIVVSATFFVMPFIYNSNSNPWVNHPFAFVVSALFLLFAMFGVRTYVRIDSMGITLSSSWQKKCLIPTADIASVRSSIRDKRVLIDIRSGGSYTLPGPLENFPKLVKTLKVRFGNENVQ